MAKLIKTKASVMILLMISLIFYSAIQFRHINQEQNLEKPKKNFKFSYFDFIKQDFLPSVDAQQYFCCEKTNSGAYCIDNAMNPNLTRSSCNPNYLINDAKCSETSFCELGCCTNNGQCSKRTTQAACTAVQGDFHPGDAQCSSQQECRLGCCILPNSYTMKTLQRCNQESSILGIQTNWNPSLTETQCVNLASTNTFTYGCCVRGSGSSQSDFKFTTSSQCSNGQFYANKYCSAVPNTLCTKRFRTSCIENKDEVYWIDSCGNQENVYGTERNSDFIEGQIYTVRTGNFCNPNNANIENINCGYCSYERGSICGQASSSFTSQLNPQVRNKVNNMCISLNCPITYDNPAVSWDGGDKVNLQSWCEYEGITGEGKDLVGSRHRYNFCFNGKEYVEECDYSGGAPRSMICVQDVPGDVINPTKASCRVNLAVGCFECNNQDTLQEKQECCNVLNSECNWFSFSPDIEGICTPKYTIGGVKPQDPLFDITCKEVWRNPLVGSRYCDEHCICENQEYVRSLYNICNGMGDYGFKYNVVGKEYYGFTGSAASHVMQAVIQGYDYSRTSTGIFQNIVPGYEDPEILNEFYRNIGLDPQNKDPASFAFFSREGTIIGGVVGSIISALIIAGVIDPEPISKVVILAIAIVLIVLVLFFNAIIWLYNLLFVGRPYIREWYYQCKYYRPPYGGADCNRCINQDLLSKTGYNICNKYRCESLGRSCVFNEATNTCSSNSQTDTIPPVITPLTQYLNNKGYNIQQDSSNGYIVASPIFSPGTDVEIAIKTDDPPDNLPSECKISKETYNGPPTNSAMQAFFDNIPYEFNGISYEHKKIIKFDFQQTNELTYTRGENTFYIFCADHAGNIKANYYVRFRVDETQPLTPPVIDLDSFTVPRNSYIRNGLNQIQVSFNVNQPATCKYSLEPGVSYTLMEESRSCTTLIFSGNNVCSLTLPIVDAQENRFYFKCKSNAAQDLYNQNDQPLEGYLLYGTSPLTINNINPQNTVVYNSRVNLEVITSSGAENGKAICYFNRLQTINRLNGVKFLNTNATTHTQTLNLQNGEYTYNILCIDKAGNEARTQTTFTVDTPALEIISANPNEQTLYTSDIKIEVITKAGASNNGDAECTYINEPGYPLLSGVLNEKVQLNNEETLHRKNLTLNPSTPTEYNLTINCIDSANKRVNTSIMFSVNTVSYPQIIRLYKASGKLYILVNQPAECKYSLTNPNFNYATTTQKLDDNSNVLKSLTLTSTIKQVYIICKDTRTNRFGPPTGSYKIYP